MTLAHPDSMTLLNRRASKQGAGAFTGTVQVMFAALLWGTVGVATKLVHSAGALPEEVLGLARMAVGGPALLLLLVIVAREKVSSIARLSPFWLATFAAGCTVFQVCLFQSFVLLGVTSTVFITVCLPPLISTFVSLLVGARALVRGEGLALAIAGCGLLVFAFGGHDQTTGSYSLGGLAVAVLASVAFVLMSWAARRLTEQTEPVVVAGAGLSLSAIALLAVVSMLPGATSYASASMDPHLIWLLVYLGLGPTALAYVLYCSGMARCRSADVGLIASMVEPAFAAFLAWALLRENMSFAQFSGSALVMIAMVVLWTAEKRQTQP